VNAHEHSVPRRGVLALLLLLGAAAMSSDVRPNAPDSPKIVAEIPGPDGGWDYASFDTAKHRVLVSRSYGVMAIDADSGNASQFAVGERVHASFMLPNGRVLITNGSADSTTLANGATGVIEATIPVGHNPDAAIYDPVSDRAFVMNAASGDISVIDATAGKEDARIAVSGELEAGAIDGAGLLFVNVESTAEVVVIDTRTHAVLRRFKLNGCERPTALAYIATGKFLVSTCSNEVAKVIGAADGHEVTDIPIGPHADSALVDAARKRVFIATAGSAAANGEITVLGIGGATGVALVERIATQRGARTIAEDPETGRLYLPTATYEIDAQGKPKTVDGTFRVLVVAP
jgi:DNA-binding beta-propeller fold protein YncE